MTFQLDRDGFSLSAGLLGEKDLTVLEAILPSVSRPGIRIFNSPSLEHWLRNSAVEGLVRSVIQNDARPVRAILFDKTRQANWSLDWHQDRTIAVQKKQKASQFDNWTTKAGVQHVEPPFPIIERMLTIRIHLDAVDETNAPLMVAPGSHRFGRINETDICSVVQRCGIAICLAGRGDVWLYRTAILHASGKSEAFASRRVLQVDYSGAELPSGLQWYGIV